MIKSMTLPVRFAARSRTLLVLISAFSLAFLSVPAASASTTPALQPRADKEPSLPLSATFEKMPSSEGTPFVLKLKNDSKATLKVGGKVLLSVVNHAMDKARALPEQTLEAGQVWTIKDLSPDDKVLLTAHGFAPMEIKVPFKI
jgi:hypothetical protein